MVIHTLCTSSRLVLFLSIMNERAWPSGCSYIEIIKKFFRNLLNYDAKDSGEPSYRSIPRRGIDTVTRPRVSRHADTSQNPRNELPPSLSPSPSILDRHSFRLSSSFPILHLPSPSPPPPPPPPPPLLSFISLIRPELKYTTYTHNGLPLLCNGLDNDGHDDDDDDDDERNLNAKRSPTFNSVQFSTAVFRAVAVATRVVSRDVPLKPETIT
ncbi:hypothetical protein ALC57_07832 [Trachymyrmex cornetzi]|uniref:Uncharacterized protein n=1 Tax=Trachymyrmex cornetzi TaxID=471704 RepID=A0A195E4F7_9HYME|nr:hypothetical protein ALC57_07832 [Trachymyrmex cornetzi]